MIWIGIKKWNACLFRSHPPSSYVRGKERSRGDDSGHYRQDSRYGKGQYWWRRIVLIKWKAPPLYAGILFGFKFSCLLHFNSQCAISFLFTVIRPSRRRSRRRQRRGPAFSVVRRPRLDHRRRWVEKSFQGLWNHRKYSHGNCAMQIDVA